MSDQRGNSRFEDVRRDEIADIEKRRVQAHLPAGEVSRDLCGLSLSGGGLRSASFGMGIVQAMHKTGLWRFVDYLSTVSGGGYIGAFLTSSALKEQRTFDRDHFPLKEESGHQQPLNVQRFIYGGHYLIRPWLLFNRWFIGFVLINLALFSGMFCVCAAIAFLWRCLDLFWIRDVARLLSLGDDLAAPFWPFFGFGIGWLVAWLISHWRRGAESLGLVARYFLYLTVPSFLIGCALLVGNGDVAGIGRLEWLFGKDTVSFGVKIWGPLVGLVIGGLFPFLRPKRLLQSGISPGRPWERAVFAIASTTLLVGLPLLIVGALARENISGFNSHPYREVVRADIANWDSLLSLLLPHENFEPLDAANDVGDFQQSLARMPFNQTDAILPTSDQHNSVKTEPSKVTYTDLREYARKQHSFSEDTPPIDPNRLQESARIGYLKNIGSTSHSLGDHRKRRDFILAAILEDDSIADNDNGLAAANMELFASREQIGETADSHRVPARFSRTVVDRYLVDTALKWQPDMGLQQPDDKALNDNAFDDNTKNEAYALGAFLDENATSLAKHNPWAFLYLRAYELELVTAALVQREAAAMNNVDYHRWRFLLNYLVRLYRVGGWLLLNDNNVIHDYWEAKTRAETLQTHICDVLNQHVLSDPVLVDTQLERRIAEGRSADNRNSVAPSTTTSTGSAATNRESVADTEGTDKNKTPEHTAYESTRTALVKRARQLGPEGLQPRDTHRLNRLLLEERFPDTFRARSDIRRLVTVHEDQISRLKWFLFSLGIFLIAMCFDLNGISLHHYYRDRIVQAFIRYKNNKTSSIPLSDLKSAEFGSPYHLISGTVSVSQRTTFELDRHSFQIQETAADEERESRAGTETEESAPTNDAQQHETVEAHDQRSVDTFLFSRYFCGSQITGYVPTNKYEQRVVGDLNRLDLAESIAISGAAISPGHVHNWLLAFLMLVFNLRLGQWLPNPQREKARTRPRIVTLLYNLLVPANKRSYVFVTDGGISENLGLVQLLKRRCSLIIAVDAGHDPEHRFDDLAKAIRAVRVHDGVNFATLKEGDDGRGQELLTTLLQLSSQSSDDRSKSDTDSVVKDHLLLARIYYRDGSEGLLIYIKPSFTGDEGVDLQQYRSRNEDFPHESSADQVYDEAQVESYRQLGFHIGMRLSTILPTVRAGGDLWDDHTLTVRQIREQFEQHGPKIQKGEKQKKAQNVLAGREKKKRKAAARPRNPR